MELKQEALELPDKYINSSPTLEEIYTDICSINMSDCDSATVNGDRTTPTGCPAPCLPTWDFSPVPTSLHNSMMHLRSLSPEPRYEEIPSCQHSEYYSNMSGQDSLTQSSTSQGYQEWGMYNWEHLTGYNPHPHRFDIPSSLGDSGSCYYKSTTQPLCTTQQYGDDIARCSTPDLISALSSLQPDKDQGDSSVPAHSGATDIKETCNVSVVQEHGTSAMFMHLAQRYQDSGYNSDLSMSPVYPYKSKNTTKTKQDSDDEVKDSLVHLNRDISVAQHVPKFSSLEKASLSMSQSNILTSLPRAYCLSRKESQIQSSDVSSSDYHSSMMVTKATHRMPPVQPNSMLCNKHPAKRPIQSQEQHGPAKRKHVTPQTEIEDTCNEFMQQMPPTDKKTMFGINHSKTKADHDKKNRHNQPLNLQATGTMMSWYESHRENPYPTKVEKELMAKLGGITVTQVKSWFANKRNRNNNTRPKVQKRQMTERLMNICHELARNSQNPTMNNADIIQKLSTIITVPQSEDVL
ncbi:uncharacterized protein LOC110466369 [Mizuhopecten yessoensis]|uniref:uncharacterized protein LOC110466369 n=1 Tax=Mizuhopecten yessoensis TaxID=6573 RepID=UPI000B4586D6|nr:uncharacterized protein LOC110466369 [Mizuhopecten yessoensis]